VAAHGQYVFVGKQGVLSLGDLREVGSRWVGRGNNQPDGYRGPLLRAEDIAVFPRVFPHWGYNADWNLYECPVASYKLADGCDASSAFENHVAYGSAKGVFYAHNLAGAQVAQVQATAFGKTLPFLKWRPEAVWQLKTPYAGQSSGTVIKAGKRLYGYAGRRLLALDTLQKQPRLVLGLTDGRLIEELLKQTELLILGVDRDAKKIERLRWRFAAAGLLGSRVELFAGAPLAFGFPPYLASLIVSEDQEAAGFSTPLDAAKLLNVLRPYRGTLCLETPQESHPSLLEWTKAAAATPAPRARKP